MGHRFYFTFIKHIKMSETINPLSCISRFFPSLTEAQKEAFGKMLLLYPEWNGKINVISRKDIDNLEEHHILHSLAIAKFIRFTEGSHILDLGTGGGFPGIPLAVLMPEVNFHLIDRIGKKIRVAKEIAEAIGLKNVTFQHGDIGECHEKFDFVVSRAVMPQADLVALTRRNISRTGHNALPNGVIALKGGDLQEEVKQVKGMTSEIVPVYSYFPLEYFKDKYVVYSC